MNRLLLAIGEASENEMNIVVVYESSTQVYTNTVVD